MLLRHLLLALIMLGCAQAAVESVPVYNTYLHAPFLDMRGRQSLAVDLVQHLNYRLAGQYRFELEPMPWARLVRTVLNPAGHEFRGVVLFLNPRFVDDPNRVRFLWTEPISLDRNVLVFAAGKAPPLLQLAELRGLRFGGVLDNRYKGLDELVERGVIHREDAPGEDNNMQKVASGRVDFTQMNQSFFRALSGVGFKPGQFEARAIPGDAGFTRHILVGRGNPRLHEALNRVVASAAKDPAWQAILRRHGQDLPEPGQPR